jgi:hypothetical protein
MKGGEVRPEPALISEVTREREAVVWPEEAPGEDRITGNQSSSQRSPQGEGGRGLARGGSRRGQDYR